MAEQHVLNKLRNARRARDEAKIAKIRLGTCNDALEGCIEDITSEDLQRAINGAVFPTGVVVTTQVNASAHHSDLTVVMQADGHETEVHIVNLRVVYSSQGQCGKLFDALKVINSLLFN